MKGRSTPPYVDDKETVTLEETIFEKFNILQMAREEGDGEIFDSMSKSIEVLMMAVPDAKEELLSIKDEMENELGKEYQKIQYRAQRAQDDISKQYILDNKVAEADWTFRVTYEEIIMEVLMKYNLVPFKYPPTSEGEIELPEEEAEPEPEPEPEKKKKLRVKKPKLLRKEK